MINVLQNLIESLARRVIEKFSPDIIGVTGSAGKTSAKEAIYSVLANSSTLKFSFAQNKVAAKSKGNLNNELGLSLNIINDWEYDTLKIISRSQPAGTKKIGKIFFWLKAIMTAYCKIIFGRIKKFPKILVLEYGADRPGDIKKLLKIARPKIGVITAIGETPVHVEFYENVEDVAKEKFKIIDTLPVNGWAVLNFDDEMVMNLRERAKAQVITFGFNEGADVKISSFENRSENDRPEGIFFKIQYQGNIIPVTIKNVFGRPQVYAVCAAFAIGVIYNLNLVEIAELIERYYIPEKRRMNLIPGIKGSWIIDDSYNASPLSMAEALATLKDLKAGGRKIAVLGDMLELGQYSVDAHENIGKMSGEVADVLITVGSRAKFIAAKAKEVSDGKFKDNENIFSFDVYNEALEFVQSIIKKGDLILVKASRGIELDKIVDEIKKM